MNTPHPVSVLLSPRNSQACATHDSLSPCVESPRLCSSLTTRPPSVSAHVAHSSVALWVSPSRDQEVPDSTLSLSMAGTYN